MLNYHLAITESPVKQVKRHDRVVMVTTNSRFCWAQLPAQNYDNLEPGELIPEKYLFKNGMDRPLYKLRKPKE